jgi:chemotaxis protein methyltransferase CheR
MTAGSDVEELEIRLLLEAINLRYGYDLRGYQRAAMRRRVKGALARSGAASLGELQHRVLTEPRAFAAVLEDLTVQVTDMFRDPAFYRQFRADVVPVLRSYPQIKIWHAGCASGEEVYGSAILLDEVGLLERSQIYATDLSPGAVARAKEGVYRAEKAGSFAQNYAAAGGAGNFADYYAAAYDRIALCEPLRRNLVFFQHDLVSDHVFGEMQVIFCRNVLIYFGAELRARVLDKLARGLCRGGFLCLGQSERIGASDHGAAFTELTGGARIYRYGSPPS